MVIEKTKTVVIAFDIAEHKDTASFVRWVTERVEQGRFLDAVVTNKVMIRKALDGQAEVI